MDWKPSLIWRHTWPHRGPDYAAYDGERPVGRVYRMEGGPQGDRWYWSMHAHGPDVTPGYGRSGYEDEARGAARRVEEVWQSVKPAGH